MFLITGVCYIEVLFRTFIIAGAENAACSGGVFRCEVIRYIQAFHCIFLGFQKLMYDKRHDSIISSRH